MTLLWMSFPEESIGHEYVHQPTPQTISFHPPTLHLLNNKNLTLLFVFLFLLIIKSSFGYSRPSRDQERSGVEKGGKLAASVRGLSCVHKSDEERE